MSSSKTILQKGSVVLIPFPFTDLKGSKVRPAVVLNSNLLEDIIVIFISSNVGKTKKFEIVIDPDGSNGLKTKSKIICSKIATLDRKIVLGEIGILSSVYLSKIDKEIKNVFGI